ncbi:hypothetical protein SAMN05444483_1091 [Salegentibacter echinorum]|uniref:Uncharacterized protein n=1 Tax=Salegentibacter echinorum TaxID=1073325 RepID=A0A1M5IW90_SALEC|nr:hypothetical protein SAMN05444483_1091 [Salegentibacter echinorum]
MNFLKNSWLHKYVNDSDAGARQSVVVRSLLFGVLNTASKNLDCLLD